MKTTHQSFSISFVCGSPGSGKSFTLTRDLIDRLLSGFEGLVITNLPLEVLTIAEYVASKTGRQVADVARQIVLLDRTTLEAWMDGNGGPWELKDRGLADGNDFILDECHNFCRRKGQNVATRNERWTRWLGEVRHEGWRRVVFVTQDESKVGEPITQHAELRFELTNSERRRDPILRIPLHYWYELVASLTGEYRSSIAVVEYRRVKGKLREQHVERYSLDPMWFKFYRSYEAAGGGTGKGPGGSAIVREFQRRPRLLPGVRDGRRVLPTWLWFLRVNWWRFAVAFIITATVLWLTVGGGLQMLIRQWTLRLASIGAKRPPVTAPDRPRVPGEPEQVLAAPGESSSTDVPPQVRRGTAEEIAVALSRMPERDRNIIQAELQSFADEYEKAVKLANRRAAKLDQQQKLVKVVAVTNDTAWFTDPPCSCQIGEVLDEGPYKGKRVERLDVDRGWVELSGGIKLWIGRGFVDRVPDASTADGQPGDSPSGGGPGSSVPEPVPAVGPAGGNGEAREAGGSANNDQRARDGLRSVLSRSGQAERAVDSRE